MEGKLKLKGQYHIVVKDKDGNIKHDVTIDNITTTAFHTVIANNMTSNSPTNTMLVDYIAVGTGTTAPAIGNTTLETETARKLQTSRTNSAGVAAVATAFSAGDVPTSTLKEVGLFAGGTATADTGVLVSRAAIDLAVTATDAVFIDWRITIADA